MKPAYFTRCRGFAATLLGAAGLAGQAAALGPHEILLVVNATSSNSVRVAETFARLRSVPASNVVRLRLPEALSAAAAVLTPEDFNGLVFDPVSRAARARSLGHTLAWVYSVDFPAAVATRPRMSLTGMTFVRGRPPPPESIDQARYVSPLFGDPDGAGSEARRSQSLDVMRALAGTNMPIPAMLLGVIGPDANTPETVLAALDASRAAGAAAPTGTVFFVATADIRSTCRAWQFRGATTELARAGVRAEVVAQAPPRGRPVAGLLMGAARVDPARSGPYLPGCFAEHLTSFAGAFGGGDQTRLTAWIGAGAAASCGAVSEPYAAWPKFPHARLFVHYAAGCTILEGLAQSVKCPLQLLLVGDPLAAPWQRVRATMAISGIPPALRRATRVTAEVTGPDAADFGAFMSLLDGRAIANQPAFWLFPAALKPGPHTLRIVAYGNGLVRRQVFGETEFEVEAH